MSKLRFGAPLYLYLDQSRPDLGMAPVADIDEGLHVMQRGPIARYRFAGRGGEREAWSTALYALTRASSIPAATRPRRPARRCAGSPSRPARS